MSVNNRLAAWGAVAALVLWCCTWMEMREHEEKDRGLLSIKFWYPERRLHFIIINRLDENMGFVISQRHGEDSE